MAPRRKEKAPAGTLLAWHSANHGVEVLRNAVDLLKARGMNIGRVLCLCQDESQAAKVRPLKDELHVDLQTPIVQLAPGDITRHRELLDALERQVVPLVKEEGALHINVSPGTPAMHAAWLLLHARGAFPQGARLWSTQKERNQDARLEPVALEINSYLQQIRRTQESRPELGHFTVAPRSPRRRHALEELLRYGRIPRAPLLLVGERGSGKTRLVEDRLAALKGRQHIVTVPCGTLKPELAMSMLFGHVKGAFTGATEARAGYVAKAVGQVLFLDEVQDLPKEVQRQLVQLLQGRERRYRPLGSDEEQTADVEVVCASHLSLEALRAALDEDLFDRLSLLIVEWPPLRACREDLHEDFRQVWIQECADKQVMGQEPPDDARLWAALEGDELRGNMRDLQRLAYLLMAWHGEAGWLDQAVSTWQAQQRRLVPAEKRPGVLLDRESLQARCWKEHTHEFQRHLARVARQEFGSYEAAAAALKTSDKTLRSASKRR